MKDIDPEVILQIQNCKHNEKVIKAFEKSAYVIGLVSNISSQAAIESLDQGPEMVRALCSVTINKSYTLKGVQGLGASFTTSDLYNYKYAVLIEPDGQPTQL